MFQDLTDTFKKLPASLLQDPATPLKQLGSLYLNLSQVLGQKQLSPAELVELLALLLSKELTYEQLIGTANGQQQQVADDSAANPAESATVTAAEAVKPPGILPWHTLDLSNQPLGLEGLLQLCQLLSTPQRLRSLVAAGCGVCGSFTGKQHGDLLVTSCLRMLWQP